jgi:hypothetical protein
MWFMPMRNDGYNLLINVQFNGAVSSFDYKTLKSRMLCE